MSEISITKEERDTGGRYRTEIEGFEAEMTYSRTNPHLIIIDHTGVPEALGGRGVGSALARFAIEDARAQGHKIVPLCPFMALQFRKHPEWADVLQG